MTEIRLSTDIFGFCLIGRFGSSAADYSSKLMTSIYRVKHIRGSVFVNKQAYYSKPIMRLTFAISAADILQNANLFARLGTNIGSSNQTAEQIQLGREVADAFATELTQKITEKVSDSLPGILLSKAGLIRIWRNKPRLNHRYKIKIDVLFNIAKRRIHDPIKPYA